MSDVEIEMDMPEVARRRVEAVMEYLNGPKPARRCPHLGSPSAGFICAIDFEDGLMCAPCAQAHVHAEDSGILVCDLWRTAHDRPHIGIPDGYLPPILIGPREKDAAGGYSGHWEGGLTIFSLYVLCDVCRVQLCG